MSHVDEGLIHAWLDGQLPAAEAARVEQLIATDAEWGAAAAEARGLMAGASRALGALDPVAGGREDERTGGREGARALSGMGVPRRSVARAPWLRAAAGVVLVAGVASIVWMRSPQSATPVRDAALSVPVVGESLPAGVASRPLEEEPMRSVAPAVRNAQSSAQNSAEKSAQDAAAAKKVADAQTDVSRAAEADRLVVPPVVVPAEARAAQELRATGSVGGAGGAGATGATGAGGGRGGFVGRGVAGGTALRSPATIVAAPPAPQRRVADLLPLDACWLPVDSASRAMAASAVPPDQGGGLFVLRLAEAVATDLAGVRDDAARRSEVSRAQLPPPADAPAGARVQYTYPRVLSDTQFVTGWVVADSHRQLTFTVRGDTLRGTSVRIYGDMVVASDAMVAVRVRCPGGEGR